MGPVFHLLDEGPIVRALEVADAMRLQVVCLPNPLDGAQRDAEPRGNSATGPEDHLAGRLGTAQCEHLCHRPGGMRRDAGRAGPVAQQAVDASLTVTLLPAPDRGSTNTHLSGHVLHVVALSREQDDACSQDVLERSPAIPASRDRVALSRNTQTVWAIAQT